METYVLATPTIRVDAPPPRALAFVLFIFSKASCAARLPWQRSPDDTDSTVVAGGTRTPRRIVREGSRDRRRDTRRRRRPASARDDLVQARARVHAWRTAILSRQAIEGRFISSLSRAASLTSSAPGRSTWCRCPRSPKRRRAGQRSSFQAAGSRWPQRRRVFRCVQHPPRSRSPPARWSCAPMERYWTSSSNRALRESPSSRRRAQAKPHATRSPMNTGRDPQPAAFVPSTRPPRAFVEAMPRHYLDALPTLREQVQDPAGTGGRP